MTLNQQIAFALACFLVGLSKGGLGGPLPVSLIVPLLSLVMSPKLVVPLITPFLIFADWMALRLYWRKWDSHYVKLLLPAAIVGVVMGGLLLNWIDPRTLKIVIGVLTIIVILYKLSADRFQNIEYQPRAWHAYLTGWSTALGSTLAATGAPTFTIYMLLQKVSPITFIGTTTLFFAFVNLMKVPMFISQGLLDINALRSVLWALPIVPFGVWVGRKLLNYLDEETFERLMLLLLAVSVILLFATL